MPTNSKMTLRKTDVIWIRPPNQLALELTELLFFKEKFTTISYQLSMSVSVNSNKSFHITNPSTSINRCKVCKKLRKLVLTSINAQTIRFQF